MATQLTHRRYLVALGIVIVLTVTTLSAGLVIWRHNEVLTDARENLANVAILLATQANQGFQGMALLQNRVVERLATEGADTPEALRRVASSRAFYEELKELPKAIDIMDAVSVVDEHGKLLNFSRSWPTPDVNVADRDYFQALRLPGVSTFWSRPVQNRGNGTWTIYFAKRLEGPHGQFIGLVLAMVPVEKLEQYFARIDLPSGSSIALYRSDGWLLARDPPPPNRYQPGPAWIAQAAALPPGASSVLRMTDAEGTDGKPALVAVSKLPGYPLLVSASTPRHVALASWRREALGIGCLTIILDLTVAVAGLLGLRQLQASDDAFKVEQHAARHDVLTGLPNRSYFNQRLEEMLRAKRPRSMVFFVLLIDLDHFKEINDSLGHAAGDELLMKVAEQLSRGLGPTDFLARLGGDEFAVIHRADTNGSPKVCALGEALIGSLADPIPVANVDIKVTCSIGAALAPYDAADAAQLLIGADLALFQAKQAGRNVMRRFTEEMGHKRRERLNLLRDLRKAVEGKELQLFFQPIVSLRTRKIVAFEALLRWRHPVRGFVSPAEFIPLAEESGLIASIGSWVLAEACREAATWPDGIKVAVNLSPVQFRVQDIYAEVDASLKSAGLPAKLLMLEITESVQLEQTQAGKTLRDLRELGVTISLDDFGTGYASLSYLRSFPFDLIKIDQSFVREMSRSMDCQIIVQAVLALGERLGMGVTAEGVETIEQLQLLRLQGCRKVQGYLFSAPMPAHAVLRFVAEWCYPEPASDAKLALVG